ncbi:MAG TPA: amidohydrolase family protein [Candidatus Limnocylindrales bacterium]|nr:amidohydrolase family protein [Candidatus Limnocylindrales bacterium]
MPNRGSHSAMRARPDPGDPTLAAIPSRPPFRLRAQVLTPLGAGGVRFERDAVISVDARGRISSVEAWATGSGAGVGSGAGAGPGTRAGSGASASASAGSSGAEAGGPGPIVDLRTLVVMPGLVDLHAHLPQLPNVGLGAGLDLLTWLERYIFPLERGFDEAAAERLAPLAFRAFARAGTTTVLMYGAVYQPSLDAAFRAAEAHGIRAILGKVMMDRFSYDERLRPEERLDLSLRQSIELCERWHGRDEGRLGYAFTPRFAVSCTAELLRESAAAARAHDAYWQTHLSEDRGELAEVARLFPEARDYTDVYDRAGGLGPRSIMAHAIYLSTEEVARLAETGTRIAHCPASNLFLASGAMPVAWYREAGLTMGLGSDVAGGPDLSLFAVMKAGAYAQSGRCVTLGETEQMLSPLDWLRLGTLEGARVLGLDDRIGSIEAGKEADLIAVDPTLTLPFDGGHASDPSDARSDPSDHSDARSDPSDQSDLGARSDPSDHSDLGARSHAFASTEPYGRTDPSDPSDLVSRLIFRHHPSMVRAAWVRGRLLPA